MRITTLLARSVAAVAAMGFLTGNALAYSTYQIHRMRYTNSDYYSSRRSNPCWATPPNCGSWVRVCTHEGWRCDRPNNSDYYDRDYYDRDYYNEDYYYDRNYDDRYRYDRCRPWMACDRAWDNCPSGTFCGRYKNDFACIPLNCNNRW